MFGITAKVCTQCKLEKSLDDFPLRAKKYREAHPDFPRNSKCRSCVNQNKRFERKLRPPTSEQERNWRLREKYGITSDDYTVLFLEQKGLCAICQKPEVASKDRLTVDHNHRTGHMRALLCTKCNTGIGQFDEDSSILQRAIGYLEHHNVLV